jgi:protein-disulfide isomerase
MKGFALLSAVLVAAGLAAADVPKGKGEGNPSAPITIEVFSDFQCPGCKMTHEQTVVPLLRDYVSAGKVFLVHREFPLQQHPYAREAAAYADAAGRLGIYEEVASALFRTQTTWSANGKVQEAACNGLPPSTAKKLIAMAKEPSIAAQIQQDVQLGQAAGIRQTPTMFVMCRGRKYPFSGSVNYDLLRSLLNDLLKK